MERAVLDDEYAAVYPNDFAVRECCLDLRQSQSVVVWLVVGGDKDCVVDDEEVCVCCRQSLAVCIVAGVWKGKGNERVGLSFCCAQ